LLTVGGAGLLSFGFNLLSFRKTRGGYFDKKAGEKVEPFHHTLYVGSGDLRQAIGGSLNLLFRKPQVGYPTI
jgi:hypothetical protein